MFRLAPGGAAGARRVELELRLLHALARGVAVAAVRGIAGVLDQRRELRSALSCGISAAFSLPQPEARPARPARSRGAGAHRHPRLVADSAGDGRPRAPSLAVLEALGERVGSRAARIAAGRPRCRSRCGASRGPSASVSSISHAARGSPSRGWPTEPGLSSHSPRPMSSRSPARRVRAGRRLALVARAKRQRDVRVADQRDALAARVEAQLGGQAERTYSQIGSRGRRVVEADALGLALGARARAGTRASRAGSTSCVHCAASAAPREKSSSESTSTTARSWLPARQIAQSASASATQASGSAP